MNEPITLHEAQKAFDYFRANPDKYEFRYRRVWVAPARGELEPSQCWRELVITRTDALFDWPNDGGAHVTLSHPIAESIPGELGRGSTIF